jgi:hypothetical protein
MWIIDLSVVSELIGPSIENTDKKIDSSIKDKPGNQKSHAFQSETVKLIKQLCDDQRNPQGGYLLGNHVMQ